MNHTQNLPLRQEERSQKFDFLSNCMTIDLNNNESIFMHTQEAMSVSKAKEALSKKVISPKEAMQAQINLEALREALMLFFQKNGTKELPDNIATVPTFFEFKSESVSLSNEAKETFARIGERVRKEFIEEQIARADKYNIPYNAYTVNFLELSYKIDEYEELLGKAKDYCVDWDTSEYDPVYLRQEIEEQEHKASYENDDLYAYFRSTRGLEV